MLLRKVIRDLRQNATQFVAIFIMTFFAMLIVGGFDAGKNCTLMTGTEYLEDYGYKDLDVRGAVFSPGNISKLEMMDEIKAVDGIMHAYGKVVLDKEYLLVMNYVSSTKVSRMMVVDGEEYVPGASGVWLENEFAKAQGVRVGDVISLKIGNQTQKEVVKGLVYYPEYLYYVPSDTYPEPIYGTHAFGVMDISSAPFEETYYDQLTVDLNDVDGQLMSLTDEDILIMKEIKDKITDTLDNDEIIVKTKTEDDVYGFFFSSTESFDSVSSLFAVLFISVALLGILTTMTRLISKQRTQIGTMKALGFSDKKIIIHYLSYSAIVTLIAAVLGIVIGRYTLGLYLKSINDYYYQNPYAALRSSYQSIVMPLAAVLISIITTYICTKKTLTENAAEILKPAVPKTGQTGLLERTPVWEQLKFGSRWNIRDVDRNRLRTVMSILGIIFTSTLLFTAFGFAECLAGQSDWMYGTICSARYRILFEEASYSQVYDYSRQFKGQMVQMENATIYSDTVTDVRTMQIFDEGNLYHFQNENEEFFDLPDTGVILTSNMRDVLEVDVGDMISWRIPGDKTLYRARIMGFNIQASDQGMILSRKAWENMRGDFRPNILYTNKTVDKSLEKRPEISAVNDVVMMKRTLEAGNELGYAIAVIISTIAVVMGVIVLYNLGELSYIEKVKEIATMKVLGFQSLAIRLIILQQNLSITILGALIGVPFGRVLLDVINDAYYHPDDDVLVKLSPFVYIATVVGTFAVSVIVNIYVTSKINKIDMVEALKGAE